MTNQEIRLWYKEHVSRIEKLNVQWKSDGILIVDRAKMAWQIRHEARLMARDMMRDTREVEMLRARDLKLYGNPDGLTFEFLIKEAEESGLAGDNIYDWIIKGAQRTNPDINKGFE